MVTSAPAAPLVPVVVSLFALVVSAASAIIAVRQARFVRRTRLGELIELINRGSAEWEALAADEEAPMSEGMEELYLHRIEILALQASRLVRRSSGLGSREYLVLGGAFDLIGDGDRAMQFLGRALGRARHEGASYVSQVHEEQAMVAYGLGRPEEGAAHFRQAVEVLPAPQGDRAHRRLALLLGSEAVFRVRYGFEAENAVQLLDRAQEAAEPVKEQRIRDEIREDFRNYREQVVATRHGAGRGLRRSRSSL